MSSKVCGRCKETLSLELFYNDKNTKTGKSSYCIKCVKSYQLKHKEKFEVCRKIRFATNKDSRLKKARAYKATYKNSFSCTVSTMLAAARGRAKKNNLEFTLNKEWVTKHLHPLLCEATGVALQLEIDNTYQYTPFRPSIDRTNNTKGYTKDNCKVVCNIYNVAKGVDTHMNVLKIAKAMLKKGVIE